MKLISDETYARIAHLTWNELAYEYEKLEKKNENHGKILDRIADWIEKTNDDPFGAITDGYPSPENMVAYLRQRAWEELLEKETP